MSTRWPMAGRHPRAVRSELECSVQEADRVVTLHNLMELMDGATSVDALKIAMLSYICWKERIEPAS